VRSVLLKSGVLGIKVAIMLPWDPLGKKGPKTPLPDVVKVLKPKKEDIVTLLWPSITLGFFSLGPHQQPDRHHAPQAVPSSGLRGHYPLG
jgi:hypothetical protein